MAGLAAISVLMLVLAQASAHPLTFYKNRLLADGGNVGGCPGCPDGDTCCSSGCCPASDAVCCSDGEHCCPSGYTCGDTNCIPDSSHPPLFELARKLEKDVAHPLFKLARKPEKDVGDIPCPNGGACPDGDTCCSSGCCPASNAVCCSDGEHCCPSGYTCGDTACIPDSSLPHPLFELAKQPEKDVGDIPCNNGGACPDGDTCCSSGCCPASDAVCCSDGEHCCPSGYTCGDTACIPDSSLPHPLFELAKQPEKDVGDIPCPNGGSCPDGDTCCSSGCCPAPNAVCCSDGEHCCPSGYTCGDTACIPDSSLPHPLFELV